MYMAGDAIIMAIDHSINDYSMVINWRCMMAYSGRYYLIKCWKFQACYYFGNYYFQ